ncbi:MAG: tyrosine-protein phosphatase [Anaerolineae bacterium]|nr:tyrosine-protein phosphatase [Anaerolineae bacterium]
MFRTVTLPQNIPGRIYLHSMPGRCESWGDFAAEASRCNIQTIVCLAPDDEIERKSPSYATAIKGGAISCSRKCFVIPDYGVPKDRDRFAEFVKAVAEFLRSGETILVHCGAGIGRTGTFAICLLLALGVSRAQAEKTICDAGSRPETSEQERLIDWFDKKLMAE